MDKFQDIRAVAFDLDGTLIDSSLGLSQAVDSALYALELPAAGESRVETWIGNGADVLLQRALTWALKGEEPSREQIAIARKLFDRFYADCAEAGSFLFPDVRETLHALSQRCIPLGIVTNKPSPFVPPLLAGLGIAEYFQVIIGGDDVKQKKPHPEALLTMAQHLTIPVTSLLFVGDSRNDIQAAQAAGCLSVGMTYGYNYGEPIAESHPDIIFDRFGDLLPLLGLPNLVNQESEHE